MITDNKKYNLVNNFTLTLCLLACMLLSGYVQAKNSIDGVRIWPTPDSTRVVFDLKKKPKYKYFTLNSPRRLVIDIADTSASLALQNLANNDKRIKKIRKSKPKDKNSTRLVLELADEYQLSLFPLAPTGSYGNRLVVDLHDLNKRSAKKKSVTRPQEVIVAIVAGHGGDDPGSIGYKGTYEKKVTLAIAKKLAKLIDKDVHMKSVMIREGDYYVTHARKPKLARGNQADLLISIHADAFTSPKPRGASVLIQSTRRANSEFARMIENREKESELLGGAGDTIKHTHDSNLAVALADMTKEHTMKSSYEYAEDVLKQLKKITKLHKKKPEGLSLAVLKAPDIPSVLIETGFMSNPHDEKNLTNPKHQEKLARAIYNATSTFFNRNPPRGTLLASTQSIKHKVRRGDSLSVLANRYKTSVAHIKKTNNLNSNAIKVGQVLTITRLN
ncbi:N-acetylmuramoyl-L-alanine amidase [Litorilituus sediminis]|nr:N-acetylmuramoyl-L-alanine amidase [Litorilituus sediminis]